MLYWEMMKLLVLLLVFCGVTCAEGDEGKIEPPESTCEKYTDMKRLGVTEGEALRIIPDGLLYSTWNESQHNLFTWHRHEGDTYFSSEDKRIHHHGPALFFLPLSVKDTGLYIARLTLSGNCHIFHVPLLVVSASTPLGNNRLYTPIKASNSNPKIPCPEQVTDMCTDVKGVLSWYRNSSLMDGEKLPTLQLKEHNMADCTRVHVYTCMCRWKHNKKDYKSTASRELQIMGKAMKRNQEIQITQNTTTIWHDYPRSSAHPDSRANLVVALVCVSIVFLLAALIIKYFFVDLVLFSRRFLRCCKASNDGSQYDVYVVYHSQEESKGILSRFLSQALPHVLEQKCGYRVFIHGRNDIPGADRLKQVEEQVRLCRRLMVVLTPGLEIHETQGSSPSSPVGEDVDWQVGLEQALVQKMRVILVQLGKVGPQGYTHLSPTLQHFIHERVPHCWEEDSPGAADWNSPFWKRVRYAMPIAAAKPSGFSVL